MGVENTLPSVPNLKNIHELCIVEMYFLIQRKHTFSCWFAPRFPNKRFPTRLANVESNMFRSVSIYVYFKFDFPVSDATCPGMLRRKMSKIWNTKGCALKNWNNATFHSRWFFIFYFCVYQLIIKLIMFVHKINISFRH